jgi:hypothetical protein
MANIIQPHGFQPIRGNGMYTGQTNIYYIPSTDTSEYSIGDAVKTVAGGDPNGIPAIQKSTGASAEYQRGVIVGVLAVQAVGTPSLQGVPLQLEVINVPATKTRGYYVEVSDDPNQLYNISDDGLTALGAAACNKNATFTVANNSNALIGISATTLTSGTVATTATFPLKIRGLYQAVAPGGGNQYGVNAVWVVSFNLHELSASGVAGY